MSAPTTSQALARADFATPAPLAPPRGLPELEQRIRVAHERAGEAWTVYTRAGVETVRRALEVGGLLEQAHELLPHGEWYRWIANTLPFSRDTADDYRELYAHRELVETMLDDPGRSADHSVRGALREIETVKREQNPERPAQSRTLTPTQVAKGCVKQLDAFAALEDSDIDRDEVINTALEMLEGDYDDVAEWAQAISDLWAEIAEAAAGDDEEMEQAPPSFARRLLGGGS